LKHLLSIFFIFVSILFSADEVTIINSHTLPPEPDPKLNNATLLGIDSNNNGVRDDVERWIYMTYKDKHPIHIDIAMQAGRVSDKILNNIFTDTKHIESIHRDEMAVVVCEGYYKVYAKYFNQPLLIDQSEEIGAGYFEKLYFNTTERWEAYRKYANFLGGKTYITPGIDQNMSSYCDFNTSKYDK